MLRQEPDTLPHSGIICTSDELQLDNAGCIRSLGSNFRQNPGVSVSSCSEGSSPDPILSRAGDCAGDVGVCRFSLRVENTAKWSDYPPMGFTQTEPWAGKFPEALQHSPRTVRAAV